MGERGPIPVRSEMRRRRNKPAEGEVGLSKANIGPVEILEPDEDWHDIAHNWYVGLQSSGQSRFYAQSDWDLAYLMAEELSRLLHPVFVGMQERWNATYSVMEKLPVMQRIPIKGGELSAILKAMGDMLITEGARRRVRVELDHETPQQAPVPAGVTAITDAKSRLGKKATG